MIQPYMQCILTETVISEKKEEISQNGELYTSVYTTSESGKIQLRFFSQNGELYTSVYTTSESGK